MDVDLETNKILLTAYYLTNPSDLDLELLDDIVTDGNAHIPDLFIESQVKLTEEYIQGEQHNFTVFAVNDDI